MDRKRCHPYNGLIIAKNVARQRTAQGLSHTELARRAGIGRTTLYRVETGLPVQLSSIRAIAQALNVNFQEMTTAVRAVKGTRSYILHEIRDRRWFSQGDVRTKIPEDNAELIQDPAERLRLGRLKLVTLFAANPSFELSEGPGTIYIELYGRYEGGVNADVFRQAVLLSLRGTARITVNGEPFLLEEGSSVAYENTLSMQMEPAQPVGPLDLPPYLLWIGANRIAKGVPVSER